MRKILLLSAILFIVGCQRNNPEEDDKSANNDEKDKDKVVINVETSDSFLGNAVATYQSTAVLEADRAATITTKSAGIILDILVEEGDAVKKGEVLLVLESDEQRLALRSATANYDKSLNNYKRAKLLVDKGLTNKEQIDNLKFETESLKASLEQAKMNLSFTQVRAPFDGTVVKRHVKIGNLIQNATAVFEVIDFESLQAKIDVPEYQLNIMKPGLSVEFDFEALNNRTINGEVIRVSPIIDSASGTFQITIKIDNPDSILRPGLFAKANIIFDQKNDVVLADKDAIIREDDLAFIYILTDKTEVNKVSVKLGYEMDNSFEITEGLDVGQTIITTGKNNLTPDVSVNVVNYDDKI